jgi:branched-subunit amino acid ABC-type transport system permease component
MVIIAILIAFVMCWFTVLLILNFYYDVIEKEKPENETLLVTLWTIFIMSNILYMAFCSSH